MLRDTAFLRMAAINLVFVLAAMVLSVLLGAHPAWATASELIRLTADFDIREPTLRVALTRMVGVGDLVRSADGYRLSERLLARQQPGVIARALDPRPVRNFRQHDRSPSENRAMPEDRQVANLDRRVLQLGLAGDRIDRGIDRRVDAAGARDLGRAMHGGEGVTRA